MSVASGRRLVEESMGQPCYNAGVFSVLGILLGKQKTIANQAIQVSVPRLS